MNASSFAIANRVVRRLLAASIAASFLFALCLTDSLGDTGPAAQGPAAAAPESAPATAQTKPAAAKPAPPAAKPGMQVVRQVPSPSGKLRIQYMRDREKGLKQIALQDLKNPANTTVLAQYKRNAWAVISPDDEWVVVNTRDGAEAGAQLFHRTSAAPLRYEVPQDLRAAGSGLQDVVWQSYLSATQRDADADRSHVTIDGISWEPDSHRVTLSVAPIPSKDDTNLPEPWTCIYDVTTKQVEPPAEVASNEADNASPNESADATTETSETAEGEAAAPAEESNDLEGEKFPATREEEITVADANELELSDIRYAINEMLARHGANFKDAKVRATFADFSWYQPRTDVSMDDIEAEFSDVEKNNIAVLRRCRDAKVAAARRPARKAIRGEPVDEPDGARAVRDILQGVSDALNGGGN
ncbi:MAG TPA: YARHG domain-containing protein [Chthoniobacterales bacterium]